MIKDKKVLIAAGIVVLLLILGGAYFLISSKLSHQQNGQQTNVEPTQVPILALSPSDIGLTLTISPNMQYATMEITKTSDISSLEYQFIYYALANGPGSQPGQKVERGTYGQATVKTPGQTVTQKMLFGTCSDVCHYDTGISDISMVVKVTKTDGKVYQVELTPTPTPAQ